MHKDLKRINKIKKWLNSFSLDKREKIIKFGYAYAGFRGCDDCPLSVDKNGLGLRCGKYTARILGIDEEKIVGRGCDIIFKAFENYINKRRALKI